MEGTVPAEATCPVCGSADQVWSVGEIVRSDTVLPEDDLPPRRSASFMANVLRDREFRARMTGKPDPRTQVSELALHLEFPPVYVHHRGSVLKSLFSADERRAQVDREREHFHRPCERWLAAHFCRRDQVAFIPGEDRPVAPAEFQAFLRDDIPPTYEFETCPAELLQEIRRPLLDSGWEYLGEYITRHSIGEGRRFTRHLFRRRAAP